MKPAKCPICKSNFLVIEGKENLLPFCSRRCKDVDLARWFDEGYSVPVETHRVISQAFPQLAPEEDA